SLIRMMDAQSQGSSGLVNFQVIEQGSQAVSERFETLKQQGVRYAVVDAFNADHLVTLGQAAKSLKLVTGGSGLAVGIDKNWAELLADQSDAKKAGNPTKAPTVVFSGSCSVMTNQQVAVYKQQAPHFAIDVKACLTDEAYSNHV
ncbi:membrane protein, partial [Vibrio vulnificus]|uniref:four-carbon acid sugar kinase family protein n=1 Tax=Vibrio vulnificus TaxID=672 RepID=UPI0005025471